MLDTRIQRKRKTVAAVIDTDNLYVIAFGELIRQQGCYPGNTTGEREIIDDEHNTLHVENLLAW